MQDAIAGSLHNLTSTIEDQPVNESGVEELTEHGISESKEQTSTARVMSLNNEKQEL